MTRPKTIIRKRLCHLLAGIFFIYAMLLVAAGLIGHEPLTIWQGRYSAYAVVGTAPRLWGIWAALAFCAGGVLTVIGFSLGRRKERQLGLHCHNEVENALWLFVDDLEKENGQL